MNALFYEIKHPEDEMEMRVVSEPIDDPDIEASSLLWEWLEWLTDSTDNCLGLAAVQIGIPVRAFYLNVEGEVVRFRNPEIIDVSKEKFIFRGEGCMSFPGRYVDTDRHVWIKVKDDINGEHTYKGLLGVCVQHEMDHLDGVLCFDKETHSQYIREEEKIGRNDPCPFCLEKGVRIKYKKCKEHYIC